ncbi:hypothetical protein AWB68_00655 [Caballeronia choica]|jgi:hypothetical protein|uniref:Uncharacterized protein n=1 Tax=Caballeronia choica TaxID=326476 RepID=A0A158FHI8_9BURK|nr:hypothetical protein [Caballeronia choica]SAL19318.1 hypothetical protein AWB68_00655 [Caballeronia choica]
MGFNDYVGAPILTERTAANWLAGRTLPLKRHRSQLASFLHEDWYYLEHTVRRRNAEASDPVAREAISNYIDLPASLRINPELEMLAVEEKGPIKIMLNQINILIHEMLNKKRPE